MIGIYVEGTELLLIDGRFIFGWYYLGSKEGSFLMMRKLR